ncbi:MAG: Uma2 family endonuclease [Thermus sp.]|uniref:Uma2 family endonuclease n=1 Tax=Thermus sp. TaxID=275 RepID=UPI000A8C7747
MVVCQGEPPHSQYEESPCLVVEVLSEATEVIDRREKLWRYREFRTLQGYLKVESRARRVEVCVREGVDGLFRAVEVRCLDLGIPLEAVYEGVKV